MEAGGLGRVVQGGGWERWPRRQTQLPLAVWPLGNCLSSLTASFLPSNVHGESKYVAGLGEEEQSWRHPCLEQGLVLSSQGL